MENALIIGCIFIVLFGIATCISLYRRYKEIEKENEKCCEKCLWYKYTGYEEDGLCSLSQGILFVRKDGICSYYKERESNVISIENYRKKHAIN